MGRSPHEAGGVFDVAAKLGADWGKSEGLVKGHVLSELPFARSGTDERDVNDLEVGRGRGRLGLDGNKARKGKEAVHMLEDTCDVGRGQDSRRGKEDAGSDIKGSLENDIGVNVFPEVSIDLPDEIRGDGLGADRRSGRRH
jgi:hypothetical protein